MKPSTLIVFAFGLALCGCEEPPPPTESRGLGERCGHDHHCDGVLVCDAQRCNERESGGSDDDDDVDDDGNASGESACYGDSLTQPCDDDADCCAFEECLLFSGLDGARCTGSCGSDEDCNTGCCDNQRCVPRDYCGEPDGDPCSECLDSCRGLPSCCTGVGCICDSVC